ncbi:MAG: hypothetical protein LBG95_04535 [Treponema sp.]|jgi:hypothetical protein|nr:hypothetical protein [Treponema sp.]
MNKKIILAFVLIAAVSLGTAYAQTGQPASPAHSYILAMAESGGSIYLAGHYNDGYKDITCYWKDGVKTNLPAPDGPFEIAAARAPVVVPITITITGIDTVKYGGWDCGVYLYNDADKIVGHAYRTLVSSSLAFSMLEWVDDIILTKPGAYTVMFQLSDIRTREKYNDTAFILMNKTLTAGNNAMPLSSFTLQRL